MQILIVDGQGGGVGKALAEAILTRFPSADIVAVGTNALATANMMKAGKLHAATGENAVLYNAARADVIVGPAGILLANAMYGEITPRMAQAISESEAQLYLLPMNQSRLHIAGSGDLRLPDAIAALVALLDREV